MIRKALLIAATTALMAGPAFATHCPKDMALIDAALPTAKLSDDDKKKVVKKRAGGEAAHKAGNHNKALKRLEGAMEILKIKHPAN